MPHTLASVDTLDQQVARLLQSGFLPAAMEPLQAWLANESEHQDAPAAFRVWNRLGMVHAAQDELQSALAAFENASRLASDEPAHAMAGTRLNVARCHRLLGNPGDAEAIAKETVEALADTAPVSLRSQALLTRGNALVDLDRADEACAVMEQALILNRQKNDPHNVAVTLNNLGVAALAAGDFRRAEEALTESCSLTLDTAHRLLTFNYTELGRLYQLMDRPAAALQAANRALEALMQDISLVNRSELARLSELNGRIFLQEKDRRAALLHLNRATAYYAQLGLMKEWARCQEAIRIAMGLQGGNLNEFRLPGLRDRLDFLTRVLDTVDEVETVVPYLQGHGTRVAAYSGYLGRKLGLSAGELSLVKLAARLHHIGRSTPSQLAPSGPPPEPSPSSRWHKEAVTFAESLLRSLHVDEPVLVAIRSQYASYSGLGFPGELSGKDIPLVARIISVANAYDSLTSPRPYRSALPHSEAMARICAAAGQRYCPEVVGGLVALVS